MTLEKYSFSVYSSQGKADVRIEVFIDSLTNKK